MRPAGGCAGRQRGHGRNALRTAAGRRWRHVLLRGPTSILGAVLRRVTGDHDPRDRRTAAEPGPGPRRQRRALPQPAGNRRAYRLAHPSVHGRCRHWRTEVDLEPHPARRLPSGSPARHRPSRHRALAQSAARAAEHRAPACRRAGIGDNRGPCPAVSGTAGPQPGGCRAAGSRAAPPVPCPGTASGCIRRGNDGRPGGAINCEPGAPDGVALRRATRQRRGSGEAGSGAGRDGKRGARGMNAEHTAATAELASESGAADPRAAFAAVRAEVGKAVVGQDGVITGLLIALLCQGHVLLEGVPGVAKTLLIRSIAAALSLESKRIQFTPDLMPGDVTGSLIYDARTSQFEFRPGPVFTNLLLADEINRTPPKTQAALLESMEERQVSVEGSPRPLPVPFLVAATQNPVEYEGTYPLPEAQLDRFLLKLSVPMPERADEIAILDRHAAGFDPRNLGAAGIRQVAGPADLAQARQATRKVHLSPEVTGYIVDMCRATRTSPSLRLGVSPRGATALQAASRAWAWLSGRDYVTPDDVKALAGPTFRHRIQLRPEAELDGATADGVLQGLLASVPVPR